mmetsp:Transcript_34147/g.54693  ORF Transcript_34147/g.54693 Transcript_34147/m.54693 type:complete len:548 (-) Transcript_34147:753-2396(-)
MDESSARQISFVEKIVLPFEGTILQEALAFGDVDNDGQTELVVGNLDGDLYVFKGEKLFAVCKNLGMIICVFIDCVLGNDKKCVVVISGEGSCYVFDLSKEVPMCDVDEAVLPAVDTSSIEKLESSIKETEQSTEVANSLQELSIEPQIEEVDDESPEPNSAETISPLCTFDIPWNVTCAVLTDVTGNGCKDLVVAEHDGGGLSESKISALSIVKSGSSDYSLQLVTEWSVSGAAISITTTSLDTGELIVVGLQFGGFVSLDLTGEVLLHSLSNHYRQHMRAENALLRADNDRGSDPRDPSRMLVYSSQDEDTIVINKPSVVLGNVLLNCSDGGTDIRVPKDTEQEDDDESGVGLLAVCFGGCLRVERIFFDEKEGEMYNTLVWQELQPRHLFALQSTDINDDGRSEVISCAWDGLTCIYDLYNNVVRFQFEGRVQGFLAGDYTLEDGSTKKCFAYATFGEGMVIYTDVQESISEIRALTLVDMLRDREKLLSVFNSLDEKCSPELKESLQLKMRRLNGGIRFMSYYAQLLHEALYNRAGLIPSTNK